MGKKQSLWNRNSRVSLSVYLAIYYLFLILISRDRWHSSRSWREWGSLRTSRWSEMKPHVDSTFYPEKSSIDHPSLFPKDASLVYSRARAVDTPANPCVSTRTLQSIRVCCANRRWRVSLHDRNILKRFGRRSDIIVFDIFRHLLK